MALPALICTGSTLPFAFREDLENGIPGAGSDSIWEDLEMGSERSVPDQQHSWEAGSE